MTTFRELFHRHIGSSMLKQQVLSDFLGDHTWAQDMEAGTIDFGEGRVYPISILGTQSDGSGTWLWAWANQTGEFPAHAVELSKSLREFGEREGIPEFTRPHFLLQGITGHDLTIVANVILNGDAYYRCPFDGGSIYLLITGSPLAAPRKDSPADVEAIITYVTTYFPVDHKAMALALFGDQGYTVSEEDNTVIATSPDGAQITLNFDEEGKIKVDAPESPVEEPADECHIGEHSSMRDVHLMYCKDQLIGTVTGVGWVEFPWAGGMIALGSLPDEIRGVLEYVRRESATEHGLRDWPFPADLGNQWRIVMPDGNMIGISPPIIDVATGQVMWR